MRTAQRMGYGGTLPGRSAHKNGSKRHPTANRQTAGRHADSTAHGDTEGRFPDVRRARTTAKGTPRRIGKRPDDMRTAQRMGYGGTLPGRSAHKNGSKRHPTANRQTAGRHADSTAHGRRRDASRTFGAQERLQKAPHGESANGRTTRGQHSALGYGRTLPDVRRTGRSSGTDTISRKDPDGPNG